MITVSWRFRGSLRAVYWEVWERLLKLLVHIPMSNGHRCGETPEPIPNSEAKTAHDMKYCAFAWKSILLFGTYFFLLYSSSIADISVMVYSLSGIIPL